MGLWLCEGRDLRVGMLDGLHIHRFLQLFREASAIAKSCELMKKEVIHL